jgi:hypothetical protein
MQVVQTTDRAGGLKTLSPRVADGADELTERSPSCTYVCGVEAKKAMAPRITEVHAEILASKIRNFVLFFTFLDMSLLTSLRMLALYSNRVGVAANPFYRCIPCVPA